MEPSYLSLLIYCHEAGELQAYFNKFSTADTIGQLIDWINGKLIGNNFDNR